jgi:hypothetical protein
MGSEYFINSEILQSKVRDLLPSQGGAGAGFDLSASTQIVPIVDLTESAEGSDVRADLQTALSFQSITTFSVINTTTTIVNNTGYYRIFGGYFKTGTGSGSLTLNDGATTKNILSFAVPSGTAQDIELFDFNIFLQAGESLEVTASSNAIINGSTRQIATIDGTLVNP